MRIVNEANKIIIGYAGENEAVNVLFDVKGWDELYGVGSFTLLNRRPGESDAYPVEVTQEGDTVTWVVSSADTAIEGIGECELMYIVNNVIAKSVVYNTVISHALCSDNVPPEPWTPWVVTVIEAKDEAIEAKNQAIEAETAIENMSATANINNTTGIPTVDVEKSIIEGHVNLDFDFKNIKGEQGEQGIQGPQGEHGEGFISCIDEDDGNVEILLDSENKVIRKTLLFSESDIQFTSIPDEGQVATLQNTFPYSQIAEYIQSNQEVIYSMTIGNDTFGYTILDNDDNLQFDETYFNIRENEPQTIRNYGDEVTSIDIQIWLVTKVNTPSDFIALLDNNLVPRGIFSMLHAFSGDRELSSSITINPGEMVIISLDNWKEFLNVNDDSRIVQMTITSVSPSMVESGFETCPIIVMSERMYASNTSQHKLYNIGSSAYSIKVIKYLGFLYI